MHLRDQLDFLTMAEEVGLQNLFPLSVLDSLKKFSQGQFKKTPFPQFDLI